MKESKEIKAEEALNDDEIDTVAGGADNVEATFELPELGKDQSQMSQADPILCWQSFSVYAKEQSQMSQADPRKPCPQSPRK